MTLIEQPTLVEADEVGTQFAQLSYDSPDWARDLNHNLAVLYGQQEETTAQLRLLNEQLSTIAKIFEQVRDEVTPLLTKVEANPMFKMLLGRKS